VVIRSTFRQLRIGQCQQIWSQNIIRCTVEVSRKTFSKIITLGVISPQHLKSKVCQKQAPHSEQATGHGLHCREILFTPRKVAGNRRCRKAPLSWSLHPFLAGPCTTVQNGYRDMSRGDNLPKVSPVEMTIPIPIQNATTQRICKVALQCKGQRLSEVRSTFLYDVWLRSYWASKLHNFRILAYFPYTKRLERTFR